MFAGVKRLQPGQLLTSNGQSTKVEQVETFKDLYQQDPLPSSQVIDRLEETMRVIAQDYVDLAPSAVGLLSGGVDSTLIQAHWNNALAKLVR